MTAAIACTPPACEPGRSATIMFVDDEAEVLDALENVLFARMDAWTMEFVKGGRAALERLDETSFDIVVTDMRMPGVDGADVLQRLRDAHPRTLRIVLSGHAELADVMRALPHAHQYLSKPCESRTLLATLDRAVSLAARFTDDGIRRVLGELAELPARRGIAAQLALLVEQPQTDNEELARLIASDLGVTSKLLKCANSAVFSRGIPITSLQGAIRRLGLRALKMLVLCFEMQRALPGKGAASSVLAELQQHALAVANEAAARAPSSLRDAAFLTGLLHDVGTLVLMTRFAERHASCLAAAGERIVDGERSEFGTDHAAIGAYVCELWDLDRDVVEAIGAHHDPTSAGSERAARLVEMVRDAELAVTSPTGDP